MKNVTTLLLSLFVGIFFGMILTRSCQPKAIVTEIVEKQADTTTKVVTDTNKYFRPTPVSQILTGEYYFNKFQPYAFFTDTVERVVYQQGQVLYRTTSTYQDSTYRAKISGIDVILEEMITYPKTVYKYITQTKTIKEKPDKWLLSANTGFENIGGNQFAKLGGKLQYHDKGNVFSLEGGRELIKNNWYTEFKYERKILGW